MDIKSNIPCSLETIQFFHQDEKANEVGESGAADETQPHNPAEDEKNTSKQIDVECYNNSATKIAGQVQDP